MNKKKFAEAAREFIDTKEGDYNYYEYESGLDHSDVDSLSGMAGFFFERGEKAINEETKLGKPNGAEERSIHEDGPYFKRYFHYLLSSCESCLLRDIIRNQKENIWEEWKKVDPLNKG